MKNVSIEYGKDPVNNWVTGKFPVGKFPVGKLPVGKLPLWKTPSGKIPSGKIPSVENSQSLFLLNIDMLSNKYSKRNISNILR